VLKLENVHRLHGPSLWDGATFSGTHKIVSACDAGIVIFDLNRPELSKRTENSEHAAQLVCQTIENKFAAASRDKNVRLYNLENFEVTDMIEAHANEEYGVYGLSFHGQNHLFCIGSEEKATLWQLTDSGKSELISTFQTGFELTYSKAIDQYHVLLGLDNGSVACLNIHSGKFVWEQKAHSAQILDVGLSPNKQLIYSCGRDNKLAVMNTKTGEVVIEFKDHDADVNCGAFLDNENILCITNHNEWKIYTLNQGEVIFDFFSKEKFKSLRTARLQNSKLAILGYSDKGVHDDCEMRMPYSALHVVSFNTQAERPIKKWHELPTSQLYAQTAYQNYLFE